MPNETKDLTAPPPASPVGEALRTDMRPFRAPDFSKVRTSRDVLAEQSRIIPEVAKAEASFKEAEMAQQTMLAGEKARGLERVASDAKARIAKTQADEATFPYPEFHPTKENAQSLGELFSMMSTVGVMLGGAGKLSSLNALNAMGGMLKGWQAGRADLFKREKETFDKEFQRIKSIRENLRKDLDDYMKLLPYDKEAAMYKAEEITRKVGSNSIIAAYMAKQQPEMALKLLDSAGKVIQHKEDRDAQMQIAKMREARADERTRLQREQQLEVAKIKAASTSTKQGQNALTFASRVYGNIENASQDLKNIVAMPAAAQLPVLAGMLNVDRDTAFGSISSLAARKITEKENRAFQQVSDQLGAALSRLESQGLASGATKSSIAAFNSLRPAAGDNAINMALYIARVKQEIETGARVHEKMPGATPEQKEAAKLIIEDLNKVVPFSVDEVLDVMKRGKTPLSDKMNKLVTTRPVAVDLQMSPEQPVPVPAAATTPSPSSGLNIDEERSRAKSAIERGAPEAEVRKRFKEATGKDL